jgi:fatty-acid desaturase
MTATPHRALADRLPYPESVNRRRIRWDVAVVIVGVHGLAALAAAPWLFSWSGVILAVAGLYVFGTLGINLCYHRLLTHRAFACPKWLERVFVFLALCCLQGAPAAWVAHHRMHHQHSDDQPDPHSPLVHFFWSHMGWLMVENRDLAFVSRYERYCRDLLRDPFYLNLERRGRWLLAYPLHAAAFLLAGLGAGWAIGGDAAAGARLGLSWLVWGVFVRTVLVWHITWSVNSVAHLWGYRTYETGEGSRNNWLVALLSNGEGWHNNHHADQRSAAHGHRWYEVDVTYLTIRVLHALGLAREVILPRDRASRRI